MLGDQFKLVRQSLEFQGSTGSVNGNKVSYQAPSGKRDSAAMQAENDYGIDVELSENKKKMLEAFKRNTGVYPRTSTQNEVSSKFSPKPPLPARQNCSNLPKAHEVNQPQSKKESDLKASVDKQNKMADTAASRSMLVTEQGNEAFLKQIFDTLGLINENDNKLQHQDLLDQARVRFIEMKSNGRWNLIYKYFKGSEDDDFSSSPLINRSIIKKKSFNETSTEINAKNQKKKVRVVEPDTASQLVRTKYQLEEDLDQQLKKLSQGYIFQKYCFGAEKIEEAHVYLSFDLKCIAWQPKGRKPLVQSMLNFGGITEGVRSKNFQKYLNKNYPIDESLAFSIILANRTLDLVSLNSNEKSDFLEGLKFARTFV